MTFDKQKKEKRIQKVVDYLKIDNPYDDEDEEDFIKRRRQRLNSGSIPDRRIYNKEEIYD